MSDGHTGWKERGGKTWDTLGKLRAHISMNSSADKSEWEVLEYRIPEPEVKTVFDIMDPKKVWQTLQK